MLGVKSVRLGLNRFPRVPNLHQPVLNCSSQQGRGLFSRASTGEMKGSPQLACSFPRSPHLLGLWTRSCSLQVQPGLLGRRGCPVSSATKEMASLGFTGAGKAGVEASAHCLCWPPCGSPSDPLCGCVPVSPRHCFLTQLCKVWEPLAQSSGAGMDLSQ